MNPDIHLKAEPVITPDHAAGGRSFDFEVVVVAYRSRTLVEGLLSRLPAGLPVVIADNAHGADGLDDLAARRPARYLDGPGKGFGAAANLAARSSAYEYLVFVNPDSSPAVAQLDALVADLRRDRSLAVVSAMTLRPDGRVELGTGGWEPTVRRALVHAVGLHKLFPTAGLWARPQPGEAIELDWVNGACLAVRRSQFLELGGFDETFFLYNEDVALCRAVREAGLRHRIRTDLLVPHLGAGSGDGKARMLQQRGASLVAYARRHNSSRMVLGLKAALTMGSIPRWALNRVRGRRGQAAEHLAYVRGLWFGPADLS